MTGIGGAWSPRLTWNEEMRWFKSNIPDHTMNKIWESVLDIIEVIIDIISAASDE